MRQKTNDCWVWLCEDCHRQLHDSGKMEDYKLYLKKIGQQAYMKKYDLTIDDWFKHMDRKSYL